MYTWKLQKYQKRAQIFKISSEHDLKIQIASMEKLSNVFNQLIASASLI